MCVIIIIWYDLACVVVGNANAFTCGQQFLRKQGIEVVNLHCTESENMMNDFKAEIRSPQSWVRLVTRSIAHIILTYYVKLSVQESVNRFEPFTCFDSDPVDIVDLRHPPSLELLQYVATHFCRYHAWHCPHLPYFDPRPSKCHSYDTALESAVKLDWSS
jgi:hypothetical protein